MNKRESCGLGLLEQFVEGELSGAAREIDSSNMVPEQLLRRLGSLGVFKPRSLECLMAYVRLLARRSRGVAHIALVHGSAYFMLGGDGLIAVSITEPGGGTDIRGNLRTRAEPLGNGRYKVDGVKVFTSNAIYADRFLVLAMAGDGEAAVFECPRGPGVRVEPLDLSGFRGGGVGRVFYEGVECRRVTPPGVDGVRAVLRSINVGRLGYAAIALGMADRALELLVETASARSVFGRRLLEYQGLRWEIAWIYSELKSLEALLERAVAEAGGDPYAVDPLSAAVAKVLAGRLASRSSWIAVQFMGGRGLEMWSEAERLYRDAKVIDVGEGAREVLLDFIAGRAVREYSPAGEQG